MLTWHESHHFKQIITLVRDNLYMKRKRTMIFRKVNAIKSADEAKPPRETDLISPVSQPFRGYRVRG